MRTIKYNRKLYLCLTAFFKTLFSVKRESQLKRHIIYLYMCKVRGCAIQVYLEIIHVVYKNY